MTASDDGNGTLTYSLSGTDASKFAIDSSTGQIAVKTGTNLDYEARTSYGVTVGVSDGLDSSGNADASVDDTIAVAVNVTDVDEPPGKPDAPTVTRNAGAPEAALDASWTAPDMTGKPAITDYDVQYKKSGDSTWTSHSFTGTGTSTTITGLTSGTVYEVKVRATNDEGTSAWSPVGRTASPKVPAAPVVASTPPQSTGGAPGRPDAPKLSPRQSSPQTALDVTWNVPADNGADITRYNLRYRVEGTTSWKSLTTTRNGAVLTGLSAATTYEAQVRAINAYGAGLWSLSGKGATLDYPAPANADPSFASSGITFEIAENSPAGADVGSPLDVLDPDDDPLIWTIAGAVEFTIDAGLIKVAEGTDLDYESVSAYTVTVSVSDGLDADGNPDPAVDDSTKVTINVTDVDEPPGKPDAPSVAQDSNSPTSALTVTWTAPDMTGKPVISGYGLRYRAEGAQNWTAYPVAGTVTTATITGLESGTTYEAQVRAVNDEGIGPWSDSGVGATAKSNGAPSFPSANVTRSVAENSPAGTSVGEPATAVDPDGDTLIYSLGGSTKFVIDSDTGRIRVAPGATLDYESVSTYTVTVSVSDGLDANGDADPSVDDSATVTVSVTDVDEPPAKPDAPSVVPDTRSPTSALTVTWTAPDMTGKPAITGYDLRYRVEGASTWTDHPVAGTSTTANITGLNAATTYEAQVRAVNDEGTGPWSDSGVGATAQPNATPALSSVGADVARSVAENSPAGTPVGDPVVVVDPEGDTLTYSLSGTDASKFAIDSSTGQITVAEGADLDYESVNTYTVTVSDGVDANGDADPSVDGSIAVTVKVTDVDEPPAKPDAPSVDPDTRSPTSALTVMWTAPDMTGKPAITATACATAPRVHRPGPITPWWVPPPLRTSLALRAPPPTRCRCAPSTTRASAPGRTPAWARRQSRTALRPSRPPASRGA